MAGACRRNAQLLPGYRLESGYDGLTKQVEAPEDAVREVMGLLPVLSDKAELLDDIVSAMRSRAKKLKELDPKTILDQKLLLKWTMLEKLERLD